MAWSEKDLASIDKAIASGVTRVSYADRSVDYGSLDHLVKVRDMIRADLGKTAHGGIVYQTPAYSKGLR